MIGLLVNFISRCGQIILGGTAASSLLEKWPEARRIGGSSCNVGCQYWCVWWRGLAGYSQSEPLESRVSPPLTSSPSHVWIPEQEVLVDSSKDPRQNFPNLKILPWWEETGT